MHGNFHWHMTRVENITSLESKIVIFSSQTNLELKNLSVIDITKLIQILEDLYLLSSNVLRLNRLNRSSFGSALNAVFLFS